LTSSWNYLIFWFSLQFYYTSNDSDGIREGGGRKGAQNTVKEIKQYQEKWLQHVQRMDTNKKGKIFPLQAQCGPEGG
jgi:hypothetical protein